MGTADTDLFCQSYVNSCFSLFFFCLTKDESAPKTSSRLFESSEDEQDDTGSERFKIKPQFEGKAGEKVSESITVISFPEAP